MAAIKKFSWFKRPTSWQSAQAWRAQRKQMVQRFLDENSSASNGFLNAQQNMSVGMATLAAQASMKRTQSEINAARNAVSVNKLV